ncbi:MAG: fimbrial protein FimV, partial [Polaromonas sp.]|nr:fimbrial protein FimV [Polaromonas sp.]
MFLKPVGRSRVGAIAAAALLVGSLAWLPAHALSLGRITVQSALGEPLRAEIDVSDISPQEAASLNARVGSAEAYRAAGLEFSQLLAGAEISLQRRPDGRSFLRLRGNRPITEPFLDLLIQTSAASGSLSRDYAILLDPPTTRSTAAASAVAAAPLAPSAPAVGRPSAPSPRAAEPARVAGALPAPPVAPAGPMASSGERQLTVKPGETAGKIATQNKPEGVSLDQMLVAMQRSNPDAFIGGNINRIKSGAVINLPGAEAASATAPAEARQSIVAQSKDFNAFRRNFAQNVPAAQVAAADRVAGGGVTAKVEDRAAATPTPDKLTLSKGAVQSNPGATPEETIARNRQSSESSARVAELSKNIADLNKLGLTPGPAAAG